MPCRPTTLPHRLLTSIRYTSGQATAAGGGGEPSGSAHRYATIGGKSVDVYEQVDFFAGMFNRDPVWGDYPAATSMDVSGSDTLKMTLLRTDPAAQIQVHLLSDGGVAGTVNHSEKVYFDDSTPTTLTGRLVPAGVWHTLEIPLEQFTNADLVTPHRIYCDQCQLH